MDSWERVALRKVLCFVKALNIALINVQIKSSPKSEFTFVFQPVTLRNNIYFVRNIQLAAELGETFFVFYFIKLITVYT